MQLDPGTSSLALLDHPEIAAMHERHRQCLIRQPDGSLECIDAARRITLGFDKLRSLIATSHVTTEHTVLSIFAGPGGLVRLLSLLRPRLLLAADFLYPGSRPSPVGWHFDINAGFDPWVRELHDRGIVEPRDLRHPVPFQMDVRCVEPALIESMDSIFIDPPFGNHTESLLGISETDARDLFAASLQLASSYLRRDGEILCCMPLAWTNESGWLRHTDLTLSSLTAVGSKGLLVVARLTKAPPATSPCMRQNSPQESQPDYRSLFERYTEHTDGKRAIAATLLEIYGDLSECCVLDVGAGSGEVARHLADHVAGLTLVDPRLIPEQVAHLADHPRIECHACKFEEAQLPGRQFDFVLMAYFLDSFDTPCVAEHIARGLGLLKPNGKLVVVTYLDGCAWDEFRQGVSQALGIKRAGGFARVAGDIKASGYSLRLRRVFGTSIWGTDLAALYKNLSFFFKDEIAVYLSQETHLSDFLQRCAQPHAQGVGLSVEEVLMEVTAAKL